MMTIKLKSLCRWLCSGTKMRDSCVLALGRMVEELREAGWQATASRRQSLRGFQEVPKTAFYTGI